MKSALRKRIRESLRESLRQADHRALLVSSHVLRRAIRELRGMGQLGLQVPHQRCFAARREDLLTVVAAVDLGTRVEHLPPQVILISEPTDARLEEASEEQLRVDCWRLLFHLRVDLAFEKLCFDGQLTQARVRERIHRIGQAEFDEIRWVLEAENRLVSPRNDATEYAEFVATYLELKCFEPETMPLFFPSLPERTDLDDVVGLDLDWRQLLVETRLPGAPEDPMGLPEASTAIPDGLPAETARIVDERRCRQRLTQAAGAARRGNSVKAAIRARQAALVAPEGGELDSSRTSRLHLEDLSRRIVAALGEDEDKSAAWSTALYTLVYPASSGLWPRESRLLYDLQAACDDAEKTVLRLDWIGWLRTFGRRPATRALPTFTRVRFLRRLRSALARIAGSRVLPEDKQQLEQLLCRAVDGAEARLRSDLSPVLESTLEDVGLRAESLPEQVSRERLVAELLDRFIDHGYLGMGDLRDAVARSDVKLPDVRTPGALATGDPLLKANASLTEPLDGAYRPADFYLRWLQRLSALVFGTRWGRRLTLSLMLPFGGAYVILTGLEHTAGVAVEHAIGVHPHWMTPASVSVFGAFLFALIHSETVRRKTRSVAAHVWRAALWLAVGLPGRIYGLPLVQKLVRSRGYRLARRYVLWPSLVAASAMLLVQLSGLGWAVNNWSLGGAWFLVVSILFNSRPGRKIHESVAEALQRSWQHARYELFPGLFRWVMWAFGRSLEWIERGTYAVDEWFRYRQGDRRLAIALKAVLGPIWSGVTYVVRFYVTLLIEPQLNPVKHFPVVTVAHKLMLPFIGSLARIMATALSPLGPVLANTIAGATVFLLPGVFGFLAWELQGNWRLFEQNRPKRLEPARIGHHGETMVRLLRPGFHSGTLPKLFAKMRKAEHLGRERALLRHSQGVHQVEEAVGRFVERQVLVLLRRSGCLRDQQLLLSKVSLGSNRIRVEIAADKGLTPFLEISFEEQSRFLVAGVRRLGGWQDLGPRADRAIRNALIGLFWRSGVDLERATIEDLLPAGAAYDVADRGLVVWPGDDFTTEAAYTLDRGASTITPIGEDVEDLPALDSQRLFSPKVGSLGVTGFGFGPREHVAAEERPSAHAATRWVSAGSTIPIDW